MFEHWERVELEVILQEADARHGRMEAAAASAVYTPKRFPALARFLGRPTTKRVRS